MRIYTRRLVPINAPGFMRRKKKPPHCRRNKNCPVHVAAAESGWRKPTTDRYIQVSVAADRYMIPRLLPAFNFWRNTFKVNAYNSNVYSVAKR